MTISRIARTTALACAAFGVAFVVLSCGDAGGERPTVAPSSAGDALPGRTAAVPTGVESVDRVLADLFASDVTHLDALVEYTAQRCEDHPLAASGTPSCPTGTPQGTSVDSLRIGGCQGRTANRDEVKAALAALVAPPWRLYAVFRGSEIEGIDADYTIVLSTPGTSAQHAAGAPSVQAHLIFERAGHITGLDFACGQPINQRLGQIALLPPE